MKRRERTLSPTGAAEEWRDGERRGARSFRVCSHDVPAARGWHCHPEYEIHLAVDATGRAFVGDYVGPFGPRSLLMTGPNVLHNWISDRAPDVQTTYRCHLVKFTPAFIDRCLDHFPELRPVAPLLNEADRGVEFSDETVCLARPVMIAMQDTEGAERVELFMRLLRHLTDGEGRRLLASTRYRATPSVDRNDLLDLVIAHLRRNYTGPLRESDYAALCGCTISAFSRRFRRHTGESFVEYVNRLRIDHAAVLLKSGALSVVDICQRSGFRNLSNFNRQFLKHMRITPTMFRERHGPARGVQ